MGFFIDEGLCVKWVYLVVGGWIWFVDGVLLICFDEKWCVDMLLCQWCFVLVFIVLLCCWYGYGV